MSGRERKPHAYNHSQGAVYLEDVDSAATTLLGTPRSVSGEWEAKAHGFERRGNDGVLKGQPVDGFVKHAVETGLRGGGILDGYETSDGRASDLRPATEVPLTPPQDSKPKPVSWSQLPRKGQLVILVLARFSEPLTQTSLQSYMFYQLKSFTQPSGEPPSDGTVARQAGLITAAFTGAQFCTAILWGRMADSERMGRKRVLLVGLTGTAIMSLGFGFSRSFGSVLFWRCLGGLLNGNIGVMKTVVSEIVREKRFQSRAFLLLPMCFNFGVIIGPLLGGLLADPVASYPGTFGPGGSIGGPNGVQWMMKYPYALPNVVNAFILAASALALIFGLEETLEGLRHKQDFGITFRRWLVDTVRRRRSGGAYVAVAEQESLVLGDDLEMVQPEDPHEPVAPPKKRRKLPFRRIWTRNVLIMLLSHGFVACHISTFNSLWFVFLSTPRYDPNYVPSQSTDKVAPENSTHLLPLQHLPKGYVPHPPFTFTGGLALPPSGVGAALATLGTIGILLQLLLYPRVSFRMGPLRSLRIFLCLFPVAYFLTPFLALLPSSTSPPQPASGPAVWLGIACVLGILMLARTFSLPSSTILVNNSSPHPSVLGTVHGIAQCVGSGTKTVGPAIGGWIYSVGLTSGMVGLAWWCIAVVGVLGAIVGQFVWEGDGHEIWLEGEKEELEQEQARLRERGDT